MKISRDIKDNLKKYLDELLKNEKEKVTLISAYTLNSDELASLYQYIPRLKGSQLNFVINKDLVAGVVIKIGSKVIDLSLRGQLNRLRDYMYEID
ncbi:F0F1 ATP synthase subunit delta [Candidatus Roizmanbacteria bacterium]|nr:F0F1 ATP synthase subunit delta [Candidatus Roizmanbacteria bacterium]